MKRLAALLAAGAAAMMAAGPAFAYDRNAHPPMKAAAPMTPPTKAVAPAKLVDLNRASASELKKLPGIGDAEAARIVAGRPYMTKTGLVEKKVLTLEAYDALRKQVQVVHKRAPPKPAKG